MGHHYVYDRVVHKNERDGPTWLKCHFNDFAPSWQNCQFFSPPLQLHKSFLMSWGEQVKGWRKKLELFFISPSSLDSGE